MSPGASRNSVRSCPTQNPRPAPVSTTARTSAARASWRAAARAWCICSLKALRRSGRLSVIVRTAPSRLVSTSAIRRELSQIAHVGDAGRSGIGDDPSMARRLAALLFCLLVLPSSAGADTDYGRIAYVTDRNGNDEIYSTRIDTYFQETNLTNNPADDWSPAFSADGLHIAFVSDRDGRPDIWVMSWDGSDPHKVTTGDAGSADSDPAWSPDGQKIVFSSSRGGGSHLWIVSLADGGLTQLTAGDGTSPAWSPDGSRIAYSGDGEIRVIDANGGNDHQLAYCDCTGAAGSPTWSRDGGYLIFARDDDAPSTARQLYFL